MLRLRLAGGGRTALAAVAHAIRAGGVAVVPTDTLYGFSVRYDRPSAIRRVAELKGRPGTSPFLLLISDRAELALLTPAPPPDAALDCVWPGPVTLLVPARPDLSPLLRGPAATVAVRLPRDERVRALVAAVGVPIISTSVNRQGEPPLDDPDLIAQEFAASIDVLADDGPHPDSLPSTMVDLTRRPPVIVRVGAASVDIARLARLIDVEP